MCLPQSPGQVRVRRASHRRTLSSSPSPSPLNVHSTYGRHWILGNTVRRPRLVIRGRDLSGQAAAHAGREPASTPAWPTHLRSVSADPMPACPPPPRWGGQSGGYYGHTSATIPTAIAYLVGIADWYYDAERTTSGVWPMLLSGPALIDALFCARPIVPGRGLVLRPVAGAPGDRVASCAAGCCGWVCRWSCSFCSSTPSPLTWVTAGRGDLTMPLGSREMVATAGVAACFMAGYALARVPGISKVL